MKVLLSWLREFAPFDGDPVALGDTMSDLGMAVESLDRLDAGLEPFRVARVLATRPLPRAERVQLVDVDPGDGGPLQIVCGAFNMATGDLVPMAPVGTTMPDGRDIGRRKVMGEWSNGMLCSAAELGLGTDASGILVLPDGLEPGAPLVEALGLAGDVRYDLEINPNRPDAMSVAGVARDVAGRLGLPFRLPEPAPAEAGDPAGGRATVEILDPDACGRFVARVLDGVSVAPSPPAVAARLTLAGMRPINSVVDASNYVMLELGQPNHAYDLARLAGRRIRVRRARAGESLETLDGVTRALVDGDLLICDGDDAPIGLAGVMGGASTEIGPSTTEVLLELAWFAPMAVARTAKRLGLRTEASARFERGCDPEVLELAAARFAELVAPSGARLAPGVIDERGNLPERPRLRVRTARVNALLGTELVDDDVARHLRPIGFTADLVEPGVHEVVVPSFRPDTATETDVVEEVGRHHGYSRIAKTVPAITRAGSLTEAQRDRRRARDVLVGLGLCEAMPVPFLAPGDLERAGLDPHGLRLANPLAAEESVLRTSLLPGLLKALSYNASHRNGDVALFEVGHVYRPPLDGARLPDEREHLGAAMAGSGAEAAVEVWRVLADALRVSADLVADDAVPGLHPTRTARIEAAGTPIGAVGEVDPDVAAAHDLDGRVGWLEVDLGALSDLARARRAYRHVSRYPSSDVDLAFEVDERTPAAAVEATLRDAGGPLLESVRLFDVFRGAQVAPGRRSLAYRLRFQAPDRTLTDEELGRVRQACIDAVEAAHPASLRG
jgi:phenylalanyl-tRNA synthetase beta chain